MVERSSGAVDGSVSLVCFSGVTLAGPRFEMCRRRACHFLGVPDTVDSSTVYEVSA